MIWSILYLGCIGLFRTPCVRALTLPPIQDLSIFTPSASLVNETLPISLITDPVAPQANSPYGPLPDPVCNGILLGYDMIKYSCLQAWRTIPIDQRPLTFGDRNTTSDVKLPRRFIGPDGTCGIDIFHKGGVVGDTATYLTISRAAEKLYGTCVAIGHQRAQGGYIRDIGYGKGLVIVLSIYQPSVSCHGRQFHLLDLDLRTQEMLAMFPVDTERQKFGAEGEPGVNVVLPITYSSPENPPYRCWLSLRFYIARWTPRLRSTVHVEHRDTVTARWFDVWAGAVAVTAMCTVKGYSGTAGLSNGLSVTVEAVKGQAMGNESAVS